MKPKPPVLAPEKSEGLEAAALAKEKLGEAVLAKLKPPGLAALAAPKVFAPNGEGALAAPKSEGVLPKAPNAAPLLAAGAPKMDGVACVAPNAALLAWPNRLPPVPPKPPPKAGVLAAPKPGLLAAPKAGVLAPKPKPAAEDAAPKMEGVACGAPKALLLAPKAVLPKAGWLVGANDEPNMPALLAAPKAGAEAAPKGDAAL